MPDTTPTPDDPYTDNDLTTPQATRLESELHAVQQERDTFHSELYKVHDEIVSRLPNPDGVLTENGINTLLDTSQLLSVAYDVWTEDLHEEIEEAKAHRDRLVHEVTRLNEQRSAERLRRKDIARDVIMLRRVLDAIRDEHLSMFEDLQPADGALAVLDNLMAVVVARAINDFAPPADVDDVPF